MALLRICERAGLGDGANAELSFEHTETYPITISNPFAEADEQRLEWYFEGWLSMPFTNTVEAQAAATSTVSYGETLFRQVFADRDAYARYKQFDPNTLQIEIAGSPDFHRLHWETLKDPDLPQPLALRATLVRKNLRPQPLSAVGQVAPTINVLVVTARPELEQDVGYRTISRPLVESLRQTQLPVQVDLLRPGTFAALLQHLEEMTDRHGSGYYQLVHFDVHGALLSYADLQASHESNRLLYQARYGRADIPPYEGVKGFLFLEGEQAGQADPVEAGELAQRLIDYRIPVVILNACQSGKQVGTSETSLGSRLMQAGAQLVLAMGYSITVSAARLLMQTLYRQLFEGKDLAAAIRRARLELYNDKGRRAYFNQAIDLEDWLLPVVYENQSQPLARREFTPEEARVWYERQAARFPAPTPTYGFFGRDLDVLRIERRLLQRNLLLVHGMGGAGKTTLLKHLGHWWQTTRFVEQVFYFGYDERAWTRDQLMDGIARQLLPPVEYVGTFQPLGGAAQQQMLATKLAGQRHLLILDNLESITGSQLAIRHTLTAAQQREIQALLQALAGGKTLVLLGSRSREDWLAKGTFGQQVYELPGLDPEAASELANAILERQGVLQYQKDPALQELLKLLDGYPLPLEVVLANLTRQTPATVLAALKAGDVALDSGDSQDKTRSILRCIEYSHSNLSPEAQGLLNCLAPFTGVVITQVLPYYTEQLKQQPVLTNLPFEHWQEVLQEAVNWGLLNPHPEIPEMLQLQPVLPFFLRSHWQGQADRRNAVETAFRQLYDQVGDEISDLLDAKEAEQKQVGQVLAQLEYENLTTALELALAARVSIWNPYKALSAYLDSRHDEARGLALGNRVLERLEDYSPEQLAGPLGAELVGVIGVIAKRQLSLKQYDAAEASYQKALSLCLGNKGYDGDTIKKLSAEIYHELGRVAQEQRRWAQAEDYYQQALALKIEFNDRYSQARTYHQLGVVAQEQRRWGQAEDYYQQALALKIEFNDRYGQASTYHQLGRVAQEQRRWGQAEDYYQKALALYIKFNDRYSQASTHNQLGRVAEEQRRWEQAEDYYQKALALYIEFNDRYWQAGAYHNLGVMAEEQRRWGQALDYYLKALPVFVEFNDEFNSGIVRRSLARLWQASQDPKLPATVGAVLKLPVEQVEEMLSKLNQG